LKKPLATLLIIFAACASYAPALRDGFVWDDTALILRDPLIRSWRLIPEGFNHFLFVDATASDFYRPIQRLSYTLDYAVSGFAPGPYHLTSVLVHATAAVALLFFAGELLLALGIPAPKQRWIALLAAFIWAIHPVQTAAVAYISGRADPLAALFGFFGCYLLLRGARSTRRGHLVWLVAAGFAFLLSALSKETGLIFPVLATALFALLKNRSAMWKTTGIAAFVAAIYFSLRLAATHNPAPVLHTPPPLATRPIAMARAVAEYAGLTLLPVNLHMERQINAERGDPTAVSMNRFAWRELQTLLGISIVAGFVYVMVRARQRDPAVFALLLLATLSYLPVSGIVGLNATVAEHWIYLPTAFLFLAAAVAFSNFAPRLNRMALRSISVALACWLGYLGLRTCLRTFDWKDQRTFLQTTMTDGGDSARILINLGGLELSEGKLDLAKIHLKAALEKEPDQPMAVINLAIVALKQSDFKTARQLALQATKMPVVDAQAYELLAVIENKEKGRADLWRLRQAARTGPSNWAIEKRYVQLIDETGATPAAIAELQACLQTEWYRAESWQLLGKLLTKSGREKEAESARAQAAAYDVHLAPESKLL
jgi:protein O-mannosyl-transferase